MKRSNFASLLLAGLVLAVGAVGCKKTPKNITTIPGATRLTPADPTTASPIAGSRTGTGVRPGDPTAVRRLDEGALTSSTVSGQVGQENRPDNAAEDRAALGSYAVYFDYDRFAIKQSEMPKLAEVANHLQANPNKMLRIEGNCDERGTEEYNRSLGERRANSAREYLIQKHGIDPNRITTVSYGEDKPADLGHNEDAWAKNRRDEFVVLTPL